MVVKNYLLTRKIQKKLCSWSSREAVMVYKSLNCLAPDYMSSKSILRSDLINSYNLRDSENKLAVPLPRTNYYRNNFCYIGAVLWNNLSTDLRQSKSLTVFRKLLTSNSNVSFMENRVSFNKLNLFI